MTTISVTVIMTFPLITLTSPIIFHAQICLFKNVMSTFTLPGSACFTVLGSKEAMGMENQMDNQNA